MTSEQQSLVGREFRHFKGNLYRLEGFAKDSETLEEMAVYRALYGDGDLWVRPAKMFFGTIERDGNKFFAPRTYTGVAVDEAFILTFFRVWFDRHLPRAARGALKYRSVA